MPKGARAAAALAALGLALTGALSGCGAVHQATSPPAPSATSPFTSPSTSPYAGSSSSSAPTGASSSVADHVTLTESPAGVRSSAVVAENRKAGSPSWRITGAPKNGYIRGFADRTYAAQGQQVVLRVATDAPSFRVVAYRVGWYGGAGAREVWHSGTVTARHQPACTVTHGINMVSCEAWHPSLTMPVTAAFVPGDYLLKLVGRDQQQGYVPLTVWDPASRATYVMKNDVFTWQAWNTYGGYDYYAGLGTCPPGIYPLCSRARVVSFDRPYDRRGAAGFLQLEAPLVRYMERRGLDVTYVTDITVAQHPGLLRRHRVMLSLGHDECWTYTERRAAVAAEHHGMNVAFFGASGMLRHVRLESSRLGADRQLVDYRDSTADPLNGRGNRMEVTANTWSDPPASWPENSFVGEDYNGFLEPGGDAALTVVDPTSWVFGGTGLRSGARLPGVVASDVDSLQPGLGHPADVEVLAHSAVPSSLGQSPSGSGGSFYSDMTYYTDPHSRAGVWDSGTNNWIPALENTQRESAATLAAVQRITGNVLRVLGMGPAGRAHPSKPNWRRFY